jgi:kynurenine formamidase
MRVLTLALAVLALGLATLAQSVNRAVPNADAPAPRQELTSEDIERWMTELSNWGRWGKDDQLGTVNLITPEKRLQAVALVKEGVTVSLARDADKVKSLDNRDPFVQEMVNYGANTPGSFLMDTYSWTSYHGFAHTHLDALCHMFHNGKMYNGYSKNEVTKEGAGKLAVLTLKHGIVSRGILMDIPRLKGVKWLEPATRIYPADLEAWEKMAGVKVEKGDIVFVRTGRWARRAALGPWPIIQRAAGMYASCARWLKERDVAIVGSDAVSDVKPSGFKDIVEPVHQILLIAMGTPIFDNCDLEALSEACNQRKQWVFLLSAAPLAVPGGTGSPLNPIAMF